MKYTPKKRNLSELFGKKKEKILAHTQHFITHSVAFYPDKGKMHRSSMEKTITTAWLRATALDS